MSSDWKDQLARHPVVVSTGWRYDARELATNPDLCPEFVEPPDWRASPDDEGPELPEVPWSDTEADCS